MPTNKSDVSSEIANLRQDLTDLKSDLAGLMSALVDSGKDKAEQVKDSTRRQLQEATERLSGARDYAVDRSRESLDAVEQCIQDRPLTTVLVSFAAGWLFGRFASRD